MIKGLYFRNRRHQHRGLVFHEKCIKIRRVTYFYLGIKREPRWRSIRKANK